MVSTSVMQSHDVVYLFPAIGPSLKFTSPETDAYNCIAYAAGDTNNFWWPDPDAYWPPDVQCEVTSEAFQKAFESLGYEMCDGPHLENGYEKIAIFEKNGEPSHAARQVPERDNWLSKLGKSVDIEHSIDGMDGGHYGNVSFYMKKPITSSNA